MLWEDNYLAHYGITGQKWGVRRFQNPDGTLTEEGKKRYGKTEEEVRKNAEVARSEAVRLRRRSDDLNSRILFSTDVANHRARRKAFKAERKADEYDEIIKGFGKVNAKNLLDNYKETKMSNLDKSLQSDRDKRKPQMTAKEYEWEGEKLLDRIEKAAQKYTQDDAIRYLESSKGRNLVTKISADAKEAETKMLDLAGKVNNSKRKDPKLQLEYSKSYYDWAKKFNESAYKWVNANVPPAEREKALAAIFWGFFD